VVVVLAVVLAMVLSMFLVLEYSYLCRASLLLCYIHKTSYELLTTRVPYRKSDEDLFTQLLVARAPLSQECLHGQLYINILYD
jgi:hypothetical protein